MTPCLSTGTALPWNSQHRNVKAPQKTNCVPNTKKYLLKLFREIIAVQSEQQKILTYTLWQKMYSNVTVVHTVFGANLRPWPSADALYVNTNSGILSFNSMNKSGLDSHWQVPHDRLLPSNLTHCNYADSPCAISWIRAPLVYLYTQQSRVVPNCTAYRPYIRRDQTTKWCYVIYKYIIFIPECNSTSHANQIENKSVPHTWATHANFTSYNFHSSTQK